MTSGFQTWLTFLSLHSMLWYSNGTIIPSVSIGQPLIPETQNLVFLCWCFKKKTSCLWLANSWFSYFMAGSGSDFCSLQGVIYTLECSCTSEDPRIEESRMETDSSFWSGEILSQFLGSDGKKCSFLQLLPMV